MTDMSHENNSLTVKRMNRKLINPNYGLKNKHILYGMTDMSHENN